MGAREYLRDAYNYAWANSDDPKTKNGSVLVKDGAVISYGTNSLPGGIKKRKERVEGDTKYDWMEHAERNAIYKAANLGKSTYGSVLYCPWVACSDCSRAIIQAGIEKVVAHKQMMERTPDYWTKNVSLGLDMMKEAGVSIELYDGLIGGADAIFAYKRWQP